ncbi:MAG: hypothetical protein H0T64_09785 [Pyrinomonadaceae bacterium]|nr:hypothetical protein [Pyrinomonadaceae bacterium]
MFCKPSIRLSVSLRLLLTLCAGVAVLAGTACNRGRETAKTKVPHAASDGPGIEQNPHSHQTGNATSGRDVFRFETFGNEGFWTDAARLPRGMMDAKFTPKHALEAGLQVDIEAIDPAMRKVMGSGVEDGHVFEERADAQRPEDDRGAG